MPKYLQYIDVVLDPRDNTIATIVDQDGNHEVDVEWLVDDQGSNVVRIPARFAELDMRTLPKWEDMTDVDKGVAMLFLRKVENEGEEYARENYSARYLDHPELVALLPGDACDHALQFEDYAEHMDYDRLHELTELALAAERNRRGEAG